MYIIFDTETTGLPKRWNAPITDTDNWPRAIQIAWQVHDQWGNLVEAKDYLIRPEGFDIPYDAERIHGISTALAVQKGESLDRVLAEFNEALSESKFVVGQNVGFDVNVMGAEFHRAQLESLMASMPVLDTCTEKTAKLCQIPGGRGGKFKLPTLTELHQHLFGEPFNDAHNATADVEATTRCFLELIRTGNYTENELQAERTYIPEFKSKHTGPVGKVGLNHINLKKASAQLKAKQEAKSEESGPSKAELDENLEQLQESSFVHLHNHTQFSVLQSTMAVPDLIAAAAKHNMPAVAITDHANMMGAFHFVNAVKKHNSAVANDGENTSKPIKPIIGCEFFVCEDHTDRNHKDNGYQMVILAKTKKGYHNLAKMSSIGFTKGFYYVPRIDKNLLKPIKRTLLFCREVSMVRSPANF